MNIKIWDDKYRVKSDSYCYTLSEIGTREASGEQYETTIGYFSRIEHVFKEITEREGRLNKCTSLNGYIKHLEEVNKKLEENLLKIEAVVGSKKSMERIMASLPDNLPDDVKDIGEEDKPKKGRKKK